MGITMLAGVAMVRAMAAARTAAIHVAAALAAGIEALGRVRLPWEWSGCFLAIERLLCQRPGYRQIIFAAMTGQFVGWGRQDRKATATTGVSS